MLLSVLSPLLPSSTGRFWPALTLSLSRLVLASTARGYIGKDTAPLGCHEEEQRLPVTFAPGPALQRQIAAIKSLVFLCLPTPISPIKPWPLSVVFLFRSHVGRFFTVESGSPASHRFPPDSGTLVTGVPVPTTTAESMSCKGSSLPPGPQRSALCALPGTRPVAHVSTSALCLLYTDRGAGARAVSRCVPPSGDPGVGVLPPETSSQSLLSGAAGCPRWVCHSTAVLGSPFPSPLPGRHWVFRGACGPLSSLCPSVP